MNKYLIIFVKLFDFFVTKTRAGLSADTVGSSQTPCGVWCKHLLAKPSPNLFFISSNLTYQTTTKSHLIFITILFKAQNYFLTFPPTLKFIRASDL